MPRRNMKMPGTPANRERRDRLTGSLGAKAK
jgi:hypothetical protein